MRLRRGSGKKQVAIPTSVLCSDCDRNCRSLTYVMGLYTYNIMKGKHRYRFVLRIGQWHRCAV